MHTPHVMHVPNLFEPYNSVLTTLTFPALFFVTKKIIACYKETALLLQPKETKVSPPKKKKQICFLRRKRNKGLWLVEVGFKVLGWNL